MWSSLREQPAAGSRSRARRGEVRIWVTDDGAVPGGGKAATTTPGGGKAAIATPGSGVAAIAASGRGEVPVGEARGTGVVGQGLIGMRGAGRAVRRGVRGRARGRGRLGRRGDAAVRAVSDIRVVIADDQALVRGSFRLLIDHTPGFVCVGEASTGRQAVEVARRERPDVVLMDVRMPEMDGVEATRAICQGEPALETKVIVLTTFDLDEYVIGGLRAGCERIPAQGGAARGPDRRHPSRCGR